MQGNLLPDNYWVYVCRAVALTSKYLPKIYLVSNQWLSSKTIGSKYARVRPRLFKFIVLVVTVHEKGKDCW